MFTPTKDAIFTGLQGRFMEVFGKYLDAKHCGKKFIALCPFHDDRNPSLNINPETGMWKCFGCNEGGDVFKFVMLKEGIGFAEALTSLAAFAGISSLSSKIVASYDYTDAQGQLLFQVVRKEPKKFFQRRPDGKGGWINDMKEVLPVLYHLPEVIAAVQAKKRVYIVEGEKDVDRLRSEDITATCNPMGAGKWDDVYSSALKGAEVAILPDNDETGRRHAEQVARSLYAVGATVRIVHLSGLPEKGDVSDWLEGEERWKN